MPHDQRKVALDRICWLTDVARWGEIPIIVTAEELAEQFLSAKLLNHLPKDQHIFDKQVFGLADQEDIMKAVEQTGRKTAVLAGLETDVCVMHSALGLLDRGYRVVVISDAVGTSEPNQELGLNRMAQAGAIISNTKGIFYEWLRTVAEVDRFHEELPHMRERAGFTL